MSAADHIGREWFDTAQAAEYSGYAYLTVLRALEAGELKGSQKAKGCRWRIRRAQLDAWLEGAAA
jgi:excisionase family DNA binding protein